MGFAGVTDDAPGNRLFLPKTTPPAPGRDKTLRSKLSSTPVALYPRDENKQTKLAANILRTVRETKNILFLRGFCFRATHFSPETDYVNTISLLSLPGCNLRVKQLTGAGPFVLPRRYRNYDFDENNRREQSAGLKARASESDAVQKRPTRFISNYFKRFLYDLCRIDSIFHSRMSNVSFACYNI